MCKLIAQLKSQFEIEINTRVKKINSKYFPKNSLEAWIFHQESSTVCLSVFSMCLIFLISVLRLSSSDSLLN